jgi:peroxiredoxin
MMIEMILAAAMFSGPAASARSAPAAIKAPVEDFALYDVHRRQRSLSGFSDKKAFVIVFVGIECPLANLCLPTLIDLHRQYAGQGVQFVAINANPQDTFLAVSSHAQERGIPFPVLKDFDQGFARSIGATRTPEVFLLDASRIIRYHGRIDDQYTVTHRRSAPSRNDLRDALDEVLASKDVSRSETKITGCVINKIEKPLLKRKVTYAKDVAGILQRRCQECHRPGQVGPFSLLTFEQAKHWSDTIRDVVSEERMPPWHADPHSGPFSNDRRLTVREKDLILAWIEQGCPKGNDKDLPPPAQFPEGWAIGKPDLIFQMPEEETIPATGVIPYKYYEVDPGFTEDVWIQAAEARPGNRKVLHHVVVYTQTPGKQIFEKDGATSMLVGWAPGDMPAILPEGIARRVPAGSKLRFELHYTPSGQEEKDRSSVGVILAKYPPRREAQVNILAKWKFEIPPGAPAHKGQASYTFPADAQILSVMPHMHWRGVRAFYEAKHPDGRTEILLSVPAYDFNWQSVYRFAKPVSVAKGTVVTFTGFWDNSADNPSNPDPTRAVPWGHQTWDEMLNGWLEFVFDEPGSESPLNKTE